MEPENNLVSPALIGDAGLLDGGPQQPLPSGAEAGTLQLNDAAVSTTVIDGSVVAIIDGSVFNVSDGSILPTSDGGVSSVPDASADAGTPGAATPQNPCGGATAPQANDLTIRELALYQTVKVPLYTGGQWLDTRNASVVQGKKSLLRVFVQPSSSYRARTLRAVLTLNNGGIDKVVTVDRAISAASTDAASDSTFDFPLEGVSIGADTQLSVALIETSCPSGGATTTAGARLPATGQRALNASRIGKLRVVVVPVNVTGGVTPNTSPDQLAKMRDVLLAYYPVADVEVTTHDPISYSGTVTATTGWEALLDQIGTTRQNDARAGKVAADVYYFGLVTPKSTFALYCGRSCVAGIAPLGTTGTSQERFGLGVGYGDAASFQTMVHELGHAHGLRHAPCAPGGGAPAGADTSYTAQGAAYAGAKIGSWGWDSRSNKLMAPTAYTDVMGYCDPTWISDYNYEKLAVRSRSVNTQAYVLTTGPAITWRRLIVSEDGALQWSASRTQETPGALTWARALDGAGNELTTLQVSVVELSHGGGTFIYVPEPEATWAAIDIGGTLIDLRVVAPARL